MALSGGEFLEDIRHRDPQLALLQDRVIDFVNNLSQHLQLDGSGKISPPPQVDAVNVAAGDGMVHVTHTHNSAINKNLHYFTEWSNDGQLSWHVVPHSASRETTIALPAKTSGGDTQNYIFRGYAQYQGSDPCAPTYFGGKTSPTVVNVSGTTALDLLPATGSGTGAANGQQGGVGFGVAVQRPASGPKQSNLNSV